MGQVRPPQPPPADAQVGCASPCRCPWTGEAGVAVSHGVDGWTRGTEVGADGGLRPTAGTPARVLARSSPGRSRDSGTPRVLGSPRTVASGIPLRSLVDRPARDRNG